MNKIIKVISLGTSDEIRESIKYIVDQLEKNNYAISGDGRATRLFAKYIPNIYKKNKTIRIKDNIIAVDPEHYIERKDEFKFKIRMKYG